MSIYKKLAEIQQNLKAPKGQKNKFGNYNYRSCEDILQAVKPLLGDYALTITDDIIFSGILEDEIVSAGVTVQTQRVYIKAIAILSNGADNIVSTAYAREASIKKGMDSSQLTGATSSYARKYALAGLFAIDSEADSDTTNKTKDERIVEGSNDLSLEVLAGEAIAAEPVPTKRVSKKLIQDLVALVIESEASGETSALIEALAELDDHEKQKLWSQLTGAQQEFIRITKGM